MWGSDHYILAGKLHLKLKCMSAKQAEHPFVVENLRDAVTAKKFKLKLRNRFEALKHTILDIKIIFSLVSNLKKILNLTSDPIITETLLCSCVTFF